MNIKLCENLGANANTLVNFVYQDSDFISMNEGQDIYQIIKKNSQFKATYNEMFFTSLVKDGDLKNLIFVGLGKSKELTTDKIRKIAAKVIKKVIKENKSEINVGLIKNSHLKLENIFSAMVEGFLLGDYRFDKYKNSKKNSKDNKVIELSIILSNEEKTNQELLNNILIEIKEVVGFACIARNLVNEPANIMTPEKLANYVNKLGKENNFEVNIMDESLINELGMEAFLAVAKGSANSPKLIVMRYFGDDANKNDVLGLVGKGLTYDSGGYSIKPTESMVTMKSDMGGAATIISVIAAVAKMKLKVNLIGVVAACENLISDKSYKPGDIIGSMAGKYIEVLNTDAEGRLTLADAVYYIINKEKVTKVIDVATLTGAAIIALGNITTAAITNNEQFYFELKKSADLTDEKIWQLPSFDEYREQIISKIADLKNVGGRSAGTITAGLFIGEFVKDDIPWIHLDIAGTSWSDKSKDYYSAGATGIGVRLLYDYIKRYSTSK